MPSARVNGIDMWYELAGDGPLLVLTHGFAGPAEMWSETVTRDFRARYAVLLYDVRGHGRTSVPAAETFSVPQFASDLAGLLDHLSIERAHIAGVSMGGMISAQFACDFPERVRSLMLCDTTAGNGCDRETAHIEREIVRIFEMTSGIVEEHGLRELIERENGYRRRRDPYAAKSTMPLDVQDARNIRRSEIMTKEGYLAANRALRERPDLTSRTPQITAPTLVSCGEWDMFYPCAVRDHRLIANSRLATIRGAAHATPDYQPQRWKQAIFDFLDDVEAGRFARGEVTYGD
jgi:3-oxoadipate enol-lactonase